MKERPVSEMRGQGPLYQQLADTLRRDIAEGSYRVGERIPSEEALCEQFGVSRITVRAAIDLLADAGLLRRRQGKGTFVSAPPIEQELVQLNDFEEDMTAAGLRPTSRIIHLGEEPAPAAVAQELDLAQGSPIVRLDRLRLGDDSPVAFDRTYLPLRFGRLLDRERLPDQTIYYQLRTLYGIPVVTGTFVIEAGLASAEMASLLGTERHSPLLIIRRTSYTEPRQPVYYQERSYPADRVRYRLELSRGREDERSRLTEFTPIFESRR
ncbi:MAG TPA: GntR family transcriptional regulator, partial [Nitrolancea sp.]|nr:GntR family transcriptional regulator [Nitrolancea sp.]